MWAESHISSSFPARALTNTHREGVRAEKRQGAYPTIVTDPRRFSGNLPERKRTSTYTSGTSSSALSIGDFGNLFQRLRYHCTRTEFSPLLKSWPRHGTQVAILLSSDCSDFVSLSQRCHP